MDSPPGENDQGVRPGNPDTDTDIATTNDTLSFRPLTRADFPLMTSWLAAPHIEPGWREDPDPAAVEAHYGPPVDEEDPTEHFIAVFDGHPIGMIQRYRFDDNPEWAEAMAPTGTPPDAAGIDYLIGSVARTGRGLGTEMIRRFVGSTWDRYPDIAAIVVSVQQDNRRSWRALEKAGFERRWSGIIDSTDPSDKGPNHVYVAERPARVCPKQAQNPRSGDPGDPHLH